MDACEHSIDLVESPEEALAALARTANDWGAEIEDGVAGRLLHLPVVTGLRKGFVSGPLSVEPLGGGSRIVFRPDSSVRVVQTSAVAILLLAAAGGLLTMLWPFFPGLLPLAPFGAILALGGWFLVVSRLRTSGPEEFLAAVAAEAGGLPIA